MELLINGLLQVWLYGSAYIAALATASSFYALFFFFWTRTGDRATKIDIETKKVYLHSIYNVLRFSLYGLVISKVIEVLLMTNLGVSAGLDVTAWTVITSQNGIVVYMLLVLLLLNSLAMQKRWINFSFGLPFAVVSYFFLFIHMTAKNTYGLIENFYVPADFAVIQDIFVYLLALIIGTIVFNHFSHKLIGTHKKHSK